jgi:hypothetical protein
VSLKIPRPFRKETVIMRIQQHRRFDYDAAHERIAAARRET